MKNKKISNILIFPVLVSIILSQFACNNQLQEGKVTKRSEGVNLLVVLSKDYGANYFLNRDRYEQYGWNVTIAGVTDTVLACRAFATPRGARSIRVDTLLSEIENITHYDAIAIMPASQFVSKDPFADLIEDPEAIALINEAVNKGIVLLTTCAGPRVLAAANLINGLEVVGQPAFQSEYEAAGAIFVGTDHPPSIEGNIITTARDMYYSFINCQAIATVLENNGLRGTQKKEMKEDFIHVKENSYVKEKTIWAKSYGGSGSDGGYSLCQANDGGYIISGYTFSYGSGDSDLLVMKTDDKGNMIWSKILGGPGTEYGYGCTTVEGGYLITGYTSSFGQGSKDVYLIKIDDKGKIIWTKTYGGAGWDVGMSVCENKNKEYLICGYTNSSGAGEEDVYLIKTDQDGNTIWEKTYGESRSEIGNSISVTSEGKYFIGATTGTTEGGNMDFYLICTDAEGNKIWDNKYFSEGQHGHGFDWCNSMYISNDGNILLSGYSDCNDLLDAVVMKIDTEGNKLWSTAFGNNPFYDYGNSIFETINGDLIVCGATKSTKGNNDIYLVKLDKDGNIISEKTLPGTGSDWGNSVLLTKEGDIIVLGQTNSYGNGLFDLSLTRLKL